MKLQVDADFQITDIHPSDKSAYVEYLQEKQIYDQTLNIPYPYTNEDADEWIKYVEREKERLGQSMNWAIRSQKHALVGGIGLHGFDSLNPHRAEIGYWLAKPYWGHGTMTKAVQVVTRYAFTELKFIRLTAHVFQFNIASSRVLEKAGYQLEGKLRQHYCKDGKVFDGLLFAAISREWLTN